MYVEVVKDNIVRSECMYDVTLRIDLESIVEQLQSGSKDTDDVAYDLGVAVVKQLKRHLDRHY